jgi:hypothetical protein
MRVALLIRGHAHDSLIVSPHARVFQKNCGGKVIKNCTSPRAQRELLFALESARTRLAIAIASETKSTPLKQWHYYLETADRMCRLARKLRKAGYSWAPRHNGWIRALNSLKQLPVHDKAQQLCEILGDIVEEIE